MRRSKLQGFLDTYQNRRGESWMDKYHPSEIIADTLTQLGYCRTVLKAIVRDSDSVTIALRALGDHGERDQG
jgi:hypothetical protein